MKPSLRKTLIILFLIGLALAAFVWSTRTKPIMVTVAGVERGTVEKTVANTRAGTVKACRRAKLSPSAGGQIAQLPVQEGESVKRGQLLLELWNKDLTAQLALTEQEAASAAATARARCVEPADADGTRAHALVLGPDARVYRARSGYGGRHAGSLSGAL